MGQKRTYTIIALSLLLTAVFVGVRGVIYGYNPVVSEELDITGKDILIRAVWLLSFLLLTLRYNLTTTEANWRKRLVKTMWWALLFGFALLVSLKVLKGEDFDRRKELFTVVLNILGAAAIVQIIGAYVQETERKLRERLGREKAEKEKMQVQLNALRMQVDPHFLFNALNTLGGLMRVSVDKALLFNENLAKIYRYVLEGRDKDIVPLSEELAFIDAYLDLFTDRYGENLKVEVEVDPQQRKNEVPSLCLQVLVENALKHNEISSFAPLTLRIYTASDWLIVSNTINPRRNQPEGTGMGLQNLSERVSLWSGKKVEIKTNDGLFTVRIPLTQKNADI